MKRGHIEDDDTPSDCSSGMAARPEEVFLDVTVVAAMLARRRNSHDRTMASQRGTGSRAKTDIAARSASALTLSPQRVGAMVLRYLYLLRSSWTRLLELIYWPAVQLFVWGFLQLYIAQNSGFFVRVSGVFIAAVLMWDMLFRGQLASPSLSRRCGANLGNLMISPLRPIEFVACAHVIMSLTRPAIEQSRSPCWPSLLRFLTLRAGRAGGILS
jgi:hypothetical protein